MVKRQRVAAVATLALGFPAAQAYLSTTPQVVPQSLPRTSRSARWAQPKEKVLPGSSSSSSSSSQDSGNSDFTSQPVDSLQASEQVLRDVLEGFPQSSVSSSNSINSVSSSINDNASNNDNNENDNAMLDSTGEILLDSITRQSPEVVFESLQTDVQTNTESSVASTESNSENAAADIFAESISNGTAMNEEVRAVLAASGQAAAKAEASIPKELAEQLQFTSVTPASTNATSRVAAVKTVAPTSPASDAVAEILSASSVVGEPVTAQPVIEAPKVGKILKFAIPAIGVWLCGPLLSLIDTSAVGLFSGTIQQAALNPAVAVTDYAALLIAFMYTGATNLIAAAQESDRATPDKPKTTRTLIGAMQLSTYVGAGLGTILFVFARPLLKAMIGNDAISPAVFAAAMKYVRIRALGMPAAAVIGSTQAACLGMQDIRSPLYVLVAAAVVNLMGDIFLVGQGHPWVGGAAGAAWATVLSQYAGVAFFVRWLTHKRSATERPKVVNLSKAILELTSKPTGTSEETNPRQQQLQSVLSSFGTKMTRPKKGLKALRFNFKRGDKASQSRITAPKEERFSIKGFLADRFSVKDLIQPPSSDTRTDFAPYLVPVTTTQVGRVSGYVAMSHVVASSLGTVSMAAQQVIVSLFYCLCPIADSLSLTAQSFLPSISEKAPSRARTQALRQTAWNFLKAGGVFGSTLVAAVSAIPLLSGLFTSDPAVIALVNAVVPLLLVFFGVHGFVCAMEGILLGRKDLNFLGKMYGVYFAAVPYLMLQVKKAALTGSKAVNLTSVWKVFIGYQLFRCAAWVARVGVLQRRTKKDEPRPSSLDLLTP